ncbi:MAG TPA: hypothetical protein VGO47_10945 [Chlamydiales bacterium]|jgi:proteasome activator subunit 4|nr:hypothetical protein [Chlamydiales bacterium]
MDIDVEVSASETPDYDLARDGGDNGDYEIKALETYLASVPYECETIPVMHAKLKWIVSRFLVCLKTREWMGVNVYDQLLHWYDRLNIGYMRYSTSSLCSWLNLRYPLPKHLRISLVKLYYELILVPGMDARLVRSWADMLVKLIGSKGPGTKRKLLLNDLRLEWWPLWNVLFKDLFPKKRGAEESYDVVSFSDFFLLTNYFDQPKYG